MTTIFISGLSLYGPGLESWDSAREILRGERDYQPLDAAVPAPSVLPANERRRTTATIKLALHLAQQSAAASGLAPALLPTVFASAAGDSDITDRMCSALASPERGVSPTVFHNSVHNAPAGYWAIATGCQAPSNSVAAGDGSFAAGLLEAALQALSEDTPVLLAAYDSLPPAPLRTKTGYEQAFGIALVVHPTATAGALARLTLALGEAAEDTLAEPVLEQLRRSNPAARALPLLSALARGEATVRLPYLAGTGLTVGLQPC